MSITRRSLSPAELYTQTLEEVLGLPLGGEMLLRKEIRRRYEKLAANVRTISMGLTRDRKNFIEEPYLNDSELRQAYLLYYTTTNMLKIIPPLRELSFSGFFDTSKPIRILDLGSGTGAAIWGLIQYLECERALPIEVSITAVDSVAKNLSTIRDFHNRLSKRCTFVKSSLEVQLDNLEHTKLHRSEERYDLIIMMNTLNELSPEPEQSLNDLFKQLLEDDGVLMLIEPASRPQSRRLLSFRDESVKAGFTVYAPCTRQANCPALDREGNWCHTEYDWERPEFIKLIDEFAETLRLSLKSTYITINKNGKTLSGCLEAKNTNSRVVSERFDEKGRTRAILCSEKGRGEYTLNKRDKSDSNKAFTKIERYDLLSISNGESREHDSLVTEASSVEIVLQNSGAR